MLYNILIFPTKIKELLELVKPLSDANSSYEIELKFKSNISNEFNNYLAYFTTLSTSNTDIKKVRDKDVVYSYNTDNNTNVRKISSDKLTLYQAKTRLRHTDLNLRTSYTRQQDLRLSLAIETELVYKDYDEKKITAIRDRDRTSFIFNEFRIDFTVVNTRMLEGKNIDRKTYELEIEYINLPNKILSVATSKEKYEKFAEQFKSSLSYIYPQSHTIISNENERYNELFSILHEHKENKPINIQDKYLDILRDQEGISNYSLTNKLDGTKYNLFVVIGSDNAIQTLILMNYTDIWLLYDNFSYKDISLKSKNTIYALDVEILEEDVIKIYIFDVIFGKKGRNILELKHNNRLEDFTDEYLNKINNIDPNRNPIKVKFTIYKKTFVYETKLQIGIKSIVRNMWSTFGDIATVERMNDGIIFQPIHTNYFKDLNQPILKWKFPEKVTIDFLIKRHSLPNSYELYVYNDKIKSIEEFTYQNQTYLLYSEENIPNNMIYETSYDRENKYFIPYRPRYDKTTPNSIDTARDTFKDLLHPYLLERITDYLNGKIQVTLIEVEETKEEVLENKILPCDSSKMERLFYLPRGVDACKLQITSEANRYSLGWKSVQSIITEIINYLSKIDKDITRSTIIDCNAYSGADTITLATGKLAKGSAPQKFYNIYSFESEKINYNTLVHNINTYNKDYYYRESFKQFRNIYSYNVDFMSDYKKIINDTKANILLINNPNIVDLKTTINDIFRSFKTIDIIVIKIYPTIDYKALKLYYEIKYGIIYVPKCLNIYRKIHNEIKSHIISTYCNRPRILDLGSGKGGDLFKYNSNPDIQMIYLVEPCKDNITELNERINKLQTSKNNSMDLTIIEAVAENTEKIVNAIIKVQSSPFVDVITSFFSLTFLFQTEQYLSRLVDTIVSTLGKNKVFVGTVMDGYRTLDLLKSKNGQVIEECYTIKSITNIRDMKYNSYSNMIEINLKSTETATTQKEYLVYLELLSDMLLQHNIELVESLYFDDPNINTILQNYQLTELLPSEAGLNSLYRFFVYRHIDKSKPEVKSIINSLKIDKSNYKYIVDNKFTDITENIDFYTSDITDKKQSVRDTYKRLAAIGSDNNCFFHSLLITKDLENYNTLDYEQRVECAKNIRTNVVKSINIDIFENINFGMIGYPKMVKKFYENLMYQLNNTDFFLYNKSEDKSKLQNLLNNLIFEKYRMTTNFTTRISLVINGISKLYTDQNYIAILSQKLFQIGLTSRKQAFEQYITSLLEQEQNRYVKDIDNEDIQIINAITNTMTILISDEFLLPVSYTSFNPNL